MAIIGAGLAGMSTAVELLDQGHEVQFFFGMNEPCDLDLICSGIVFLLHSILYIPSIFVVISLLTYLACRIQFDPLNSQSPFLLFARNF